MCITLRGMTEKQTGAGVRNRERGRRRETVQWKEYPDVVDQVRRLAAQEFPTRRGEAFEWREGQGNVSAMVSRLVTEALRQRALAPRFQDPDKS